MFERACCAGRELFSPLQLSFGHAWKHIVLMLKGTGEARISDPVCIQYRWLLAWPHSSQPGASVWPGAQRARPCWRLCCRLAGAASCRVDPVRLYFRQPHCSHHAKPHHKPLFHPSQLELDCMCDPQLHTHGCASVLNPCLQRVQDLQARRSRCCRSCCCGRRSGWQPRRRRCRPRLRRRRRQRRLAGLTACRGRRCCWTRLGTPAKLCR